MKRNQLPSRAGLFWTGIKKTHLFVGVDEKVVHFIIEVSELQLSLGNSARILWSAEHLIDPLACKTTSASPGLPLLLGRRRHGGSQIQAAAAQT